MYASNQTAKILSSNRKGRFGAYAAVIVMSVLVTVLVMAGVEGEFAIPTEPSLYTAWTVAAGAIGGGLALFAARGWLGLSGALGYIRAFVGSLAAALIGAVIVGVLILPIYGGFYAPVLMLSAFVAQPLLAVIWVGVYFGAHYLFTAQVEPSQEEYQVATLRYASSELSSLTQAQLYRRK